VEMRGEEKELWEKAKPYLDGCHLKDDAPREIIEAVKRLHEISWDLNRKQ